MLCCPACGSTEVFVESGGYTGMIYRCKRCGYRGSLVVEVDEESTGPKEREKTPDM
jgi:transposase-like protein